MILALESSCDETAVAVFDPSRGLTGEWVHSQIALHEAYGGVVPDLASREHLAHFGPLMARRNSFTKATETEVTAKVGDLVELFRAFGPQFKVVVLDTEAFEYRPGQGGDEGFTAGEVDPFQAGVHQRVDDREVVVCAEDTGPGLLEAVDPGERGRNITLVVAEEARDVAPRREGNAQLPA